MRLRTGLMGIALSLALAVGCGSGSSPVAADGGANGPDGAGGSSGAGGAGGSGGSDPRCTEFHVGGQNDPGIGGPATAHVAAQAVADYAGAMQTQLGSLVNACKSLAVSLGASSANQAQADADPTLRTLAKAWCALAVRSIGAQTARAGGEITVQAPPAVCKLSVAAKLACQGTCAGVAACDGTANPPRCTGGTLTNGYCVDGKLEGGCVVDARCDASCDVAGAANAVCPVSTLAVATSGAVDPSAATALKAALEANLPTLLALNAHVAVEARLAPVVSGNADAIVEMKPACIVQVVAVASGSVEDVSVAARASSDVIAAVQP